MAFRGDTARQGRAKRTPSLGKQPDAIPKPGSAGGWSGAGWCPRGNLRGIKGRKKKTLEPPGQSSLLLVQVAGDLLESTGKMMLHWWTSRFVLFFNEQPSSKITCKKSDSRWVNSK